MASLGEGCGPQRPERRKAGRGRTKPSLRSPVLSVVAPLALQRDYSLRSCSWFSAVPHCLRDQLLLTPWSPAHVRPWVCKG